MAGLKAIRRRITSIRNTRQITRAMKLVSAAKLKRAEEAAVAGRTFTERLETVLAAALAGLPENFTHPLLTSGESQKVSNRRAVVISGERGLCGAYNTNVIKAVLAQEFHGPLRSDFVAVGRRTVSTAKRLRWTVAENYEGLPEDISKWPIEQIVSSLLQRYQSGASDEIVLYYTRFISGLQQEVRREVLVPISKASFVAKLLKQGGASVIDEKQFGYDPEPTALFTALLPLYLRAKFRGAVLEAKASEHASRMAAMDAATTNADDLTARLQLFYNRARQSAITRELIDIIGGAEALE